MRIAAVQIRSDFPHPVARTDHLWIEAPDGCRLAARLWRPQTAEPVPVILEAVPYRKGDGTAAGATQILVLEYDQNDRLGWVLTQNGDRTFSIDFRVQHRR